MYEDYGEEDFDRGLDWEDDLYEIDFANPGSNSALRAATKDNPRNLPCPTCGWPNMLTPADVARGYQCDGCANAMETGRDINYYEGDE